MWTRGYHRCSHILKQYQISQWKQRKYKYRVLFFLLHSSFETEQSQKYLQVCNSLWCTRKDHLKLAAAQIKCITSTVTAPLFLLLKKLSNFKWERKYKTNFAFITFQTQWRPSLDLGSLTLNLDTVYYQEQPPEKTSKSRIQSKRRCQ